MLLDLSSNKLSNYTSTGHLLNYTSTPDYGRLPEPWGPGINITIIIIIINTLLLLLLLSLLLSYYTIMNYDDIL